METLKHILTISLVVLLCAAPSLAQDGDTANAPKVVEVYAEDSVITFVSSTSETVSVDLEHEKTLPYILHVGDIGVLIFDGQDPRESNLGDLYALRRQLKSKAWTVAISTTPCDTLPMRTQLTLFDDDPVDILLSPTALPEAYNAWASTECIAYPAKENPLTFKTKSFSLPEVKKKKK